MTIAEDIANVNKDNVIAILKEHNSRLEKLLAEHGISATGELPSDGVIAYFYLSDRNWKADIKFRDTSIATSRELVVSGSGPCKHKDNARINSKMFMMWTLRRYGYMEL